MRDLKQLVELALADCSVLLGRPLTKGEREAVTHTVSLMDAICTNVHTENTRLIARLAECREDGGPPDEMAVAI